MPESLTPPNQTAKLEHANAARLWLFSLANQIDERQLAPKQHLDDLGRLIVADARESLLTSLETSGSDNDGQSIEQYDDWLIEMINLQLELLPHKTPANAIAIFPRFSQVDLKLALDILQRTRLAIL
ncbi:MAG: hypothetical protein JO170_33485 [Verrucomicrobia bacterium]|nr:hypothetical protein [Verrucomicrobiota bacterium]